MPRVPPAPPPPIPSGATLDQTVADDIARNAAKATQARDYWRTAFGTLSADPFASGGDPETLRVIRGIPNIALDRSPDPLVSRGAVLSSRDRADPNGGLIDFSGCGASGAELAGFLGVGGDLGAVLDAVRTLDDAARGIPPRRAPGTGVRACRELFDAVRRVDTARQSATAGRVTRSEALALHRQEGGFCVTPDARSYPHAPLTATRSGTCRTPDVTLGRNEDGAARPGFNLTFRMRGVSAQDAADVPEVVRVQTLLVNALVLGGLDILTSPRAVAGHPGDELRALVKAALAPAGPLGRDSTAGIFAQSDVLIDFCVGVAMIELETRTRLPDDVEAFIEDVRTRLGRLVAAHNHEARTAGSGIEVMLRSDDARDVRGICRLHADWYGSRTDPDTLNPWGARSESAGVRPGLSPFMAYLRFNLGDTSFMTTVLRTAVRLKSLEDRWGRRDAARWPGGVLEVIRRVGAPGHGRRDAFARAEREWARLARPDQHAWKVAGLIERLHQRGSYPTWAPAGAPAEAGVPMSVAAVARRALAEVAVSGLWPAIGAALEWTPLDVIAELGIPTDRRAFIRSHSFARLRIVYDAAFTAAGVAPDPRRAW